MIRMVCRYLVLPGPAGMMIGKYITPDSVNCVYPSNFCTVFRPTTRFVDGFSVLRRRSAMSSTKEHPVETREFQAEARQVLDLMVHAIYSNRDIFLRELISNASDALDRLRFEAIAKPELVPPDTELKIVLVVDKQARTLAVSDNGIGMTRDEVINLIGTIAKSGTKDFVRQIQEARNAAAPELIGQFGVGFYSAFMVADKVTLITRRAGEPAATKWESAGESTYTIGEAERPEQGTTVIVHLRPPDEDNALADYTQTWKIKEIVKKYSDFVAYPIRMDVEHTDDKGKTSVETETLNSMKAIWLREDGVSDEEYHEFYKHISHDWNEPLEIIRARMEGVLLYRLLLFIPSRAPFDLFFRDARHGVQLYVKRVFIMDDCEALLPPYLRFVRGVVDSEDLSLNISRELLQQDRQIERMRKGITGKVLESLRDMRERNPEKYRAFWKEFGRVLKEGLFHAPEKRGELLDLCLFASTHSESDPTTLKEYVARMKEGQEAIYYMTGESRKAIENSPHLEAFRAKGYEVLILDEPVDEVWTTAVFEYEGKRLQNAGKGDIELGSDDERKQEESSRKEKIERHASLLECLKTKLDEYVKEVRLSSRLTESPACLVGEPGDLSPQLEQLLRAANQPVPTVKRILEVNADHAILRALQSIYDAHREDPRIGDYARLLYGVATLAEGGQVPDPAEFSKCMARVMVEAMR